MTSNNPLFLGFPAVRKAMYRDFPDDLRPSRLASLLAHAGTATEYVFPLLLSGALGSEDWKRGLGLAVMLAFHIFITCNVPMAVPLEWNVFMVYAAFFLFGLRGQGVNTPGVTIDIANRNDFASVSVFGVHSPVLRIYLSVALVLVPLLGNFFPQHVSFLGSMRYYAGNWAYSVWLFRGDSSKKLDALVKASGNVADQLRKFYGEKCVMETLPKVMAFRLMHMHGRALHTLIPKAIDAWDIGSYEWMDGEIVCGICLGWNFGDGHLHDMQLLRAVQAQCNFKAGELRCIFVESQPLFGSALQWTIADAHKGILEEGRLPVGDICDLQPYPENVDDYLKK